MRPPHQHSAATTPALRGPTRSSQPPQMAAEMPSSTKNSVYIQPRSNWVQSQLVVNSALPVMSELAAEGGGSPGQTIGLPVPAATPSARPSGSQNTLKP